MSQKTAGILDLPLLDEEEREQVIGAWNSTEARYTPDQWLHQLFEQQVERTAEAVALVYEDQHLSYSELNRRANRLARYLRSQRVIADCPVAVYIERSQEMLIALLGVLKAGGAYVPIDPAYPAKRIAYMLEDCGAEVVLTQQGLVANLPECRATVIGLDCECGPMEQQSDANLGSRLEGDKLAEII